MYRFRVRAFNEIGNSIPGRPLYSFSLYSSFWLKDILNIGERKSILIWTGIPSDAFMIDPHNQWCSITCCNLIFFDQNRCPFWRIRDRHPWRTHCPLFHPLPSSWGRSPTPRHCTGWSLIQRTIQNPDETMFLQFRAKALGTPRPNILWQKDEVSPIATDISIWVRQFSHQSHNY